MDPQFLAHFPGGCLLIRLTDHQVSAHSGIPFSGLDVLRHLPFLKQDRFPVRGVHHHMNAAVDEGGIAMATLAGSGTDDRPGGIVNDLKKFIGHFAFRLFFVKTISPSFTSAKMVSASLPARIISASGSSTVRSTARRIGRAPYSG